MNFFVKSDDKTSYPLNILHGMVIIISMNWHFYNAIFIIVETKTYLYLNR